MPPALMYVHVFCGLQLFVFRMIRLHPSNWSTISEKPVPARSVEPIPDPTGAMGFGGPTLSWRMAIAHCDVVNIC